MRSDFWDASGIHDGCTGMPQDLQERQFQAGCLTDSEVVLDASKSDR